MSLKTCPFCGGNPEVKTIGHGGNKKYYSIFCSCGAATKVYPSEDACAKVWNTRDFGWISVDAALPEDSDKVLVAIKSIKKGTLSWDKASYSDEEWHGVKSAYEVVAWRSVQAYEG